MMMKPSPSPETPSLLLVDDDALNREVAQAQLRTIGLSADVAGDGASAVSMASEKLYDLILMDIQMPGMDGCEAARRILAKRAGSRTRIVALTAFGLPEFRDASLAAGMVDFLVKPVKTAELRDCLRRWLPPGSVPVPPAPADGQGSSLIAELAKIGGFADAATLEALGIKTEKYPLLLAKFLDIHGQTVARAGAALAEGRQDEARRLVHTLKGTAATLGLMATSAAAARLDKQLAAPEQSASIAELYKILEDTHSDQLATLRRLLSPAA